MILNYVVSEELVSMSNWFSWSDHGPFDLLHYEFGRIEKVGDFTFPDLRDKSDLILASDYSGEHQQPEFQVLSFLLTHRRSVLLDWEAARSRVRKKYLGDGRRMSFKQLNDARRINALCEFLEAADLLNGLLVCVAVEKSHTLSNRIPTENLRHGWSPDTLQKLLRICLFGSTLINGLRGLGQNIHWITDDDAIVASQEAVHDAILQLEAMLRNFPRETPRLSLGIASHFVDGLQAEDLVAIPDLAAGTFSESLIELRKERISVTQTGPSSVDVFLKTKSAIITAWRSDPNTKLQHFDVVLRVAEDGRDLISFGRPFLRHPLSETIIPYAKPLNSKWRRALVEATKRSRIHTNGLLILPRYWRRRPLR